MPILYQTEARDTTALQAAQEFARRYWDLPRRIEKTWEKGGELRFQVQDGTRTYRVIHQERVAFVSPALWQIVVEE